MYKLLTLLLAFLCHSNSYSQRIQIIESDVLDDSNYFSDFTDDGNGNFYAVSRAGGIFKFDLDGNVEKYNVDCLRTNCLDVEVNSEGQLFFASSTGITTIDKNGEMIVLYRDFLREITLGPNGEIYFIGDSVAENLYGVFKDGEVTGFDEDNSIITEPNFYAIESDDLGNIWFAGQDGVYRATPDDFELVSDRQTFDLHIDKENIVYVAQGSGQLALLDPKEDYEYNVVDDADGRFFVGESGSSKLAVDDFGNMRYECSGVWKDIDLSDQGISKDIPRAAYVDGAGNILYAKDRDDNIYVIAPTDACGEDKSFSSQTVARIINQPWQFIIAYSSGAEITDIELLLDEEIPIYFESVNSQIASINTTGLPTGSYIVKLYSKDDASTKKIVIE